MFFHLFDHMLASITMPLRLHIPAAKYLLCLAVLCSFSKATGFLHYELLKISHFNEGKQKLVKFSDLLIRFRNRQSHPHVHYDTDVENDPSDKALDRLKGDRVLRFDEVAVCGTYDPISPCMRMNYVGLLLVVR